MLDVYTKNFFPKFLGKFVERDKDGNIKYKTEDGRIVAASDKDAQVVDEPRMWLEGY